MNTRRTFTPRLALVLLLAAHAVPSAAQNAVTDWSRQAQLAITPFRPPATSNYLLALVHAAMYDAAVAVDGRFEPFRVAVPIVRPASSSAAVAAAAYHVLRERMPSQEPALTAAYTDFLATIDDGPAKSNGLSVGQQVAAVWLGLRVLDGLANTVTYVQPAPGPGVWEPTLPAAPAEIVLMQAQPYVLNANDQFRPKGPRRLAGLSYARAVAEVRALGRNDSTTRTPEQTETARFWAEHPAAQWNRNLRQIAITRQLDVVESARLLAMAYTAAADALVGCFDAKYHFLFWRPVHAIQRADTDGNPFTIADPTWSALLNVNHPEYPSAHACLSTAVTDVLAFYFGHDRTRVALDSATTGTAREYSRFSDIAREVNDARVYAGLHFRFSLRDGSRLAHHVAREVTVHYFKSVPRRRPHDQDDDR